MFCKFTIRRLHVTVETWYSHWCYITLKWKEAQLSETENTRPVMNPDRVWQISYTGDNVNDEKKLQKVLITIGMMVLLIAIGRMATLQMISPILCRICGVVHASTQLWSKESCQRRKILLEEKQDNLSSFWLYTYRHVIVWAMTSDCAHKGTSL